MVTAILTASRVLVGVSARSLADVEDTVTLTQFRTLVVLNSHGMINLNRLADLLGVNSSTAMRMIDRLLAAELVTRQDNPANRREVLLDLTDEGRQLVQQVSDTRRAEIARIVKAMPAEANAANWSTRCGRSPTPPASPKPPKPWPGSAGNATPACPRRVGAFEVPAARCRSYRPGRFMEPDAPATFACCMHGDAGREPSEASATSAKENLMRTLHMRPTNGLRADRRTAAVVSGLVALATSTAVPLVLQRGRRHRAAVRRFSESPAAPAEPGVPTLSNPIDLPEPTSTPELGLHDTAPPAAATAAGNEQSAYGLGFDQHSTHARGRPIAWVVVAVIVAGTCVSGISLIMSAPWLFWTGLGAVVVGIGVGGVTHAMRDEMAPVPSRSADQPNSPVVGSVNGLHRGMSGASLAQRRIGL